MTEPSLHLVDSAPLRSLVSLPEGPLPASGAWPVLCFLHGYDEAAPLEIRRGLTRHGPLRPGSSPRAVRDFVIVAPQLPRPGDLWHAYADPVHELVLQVQALHRGDPRRTYLSGFSFGANGVLDLALRQRQFWAALWPVDPTRVPPDDPGLPIWLSSGEISRRRGSGFIERLRLAPAGASVPGDRIYTDEGRDHVGTAEIAYRDDRIYDWLLRRERPPAVDPLSVSPRTGERSGGWDDPGAA